MKTALILFTGLIAVCAFGTSCNNITGKTDINARAQVAIKELNLPDIPETLTSPQERGSFLAAHFWDGLDELTPEQRRDTALIEQTFANFLGILPYVAEPEESVRILIEKNVAHADGLRLVEFLADKYLADPNSPMRSEDLYLLFVRRFSTDARMPDDVRMRGEFHLEQALKNRPGDRAANFRLVTREGASDTFLDMLAADTTIVMFYDPECSQCREITSRLSAEDVLLPYRLLAVDVAGNRPAWDATAASLPAGWAVAYATTPVEDEDLYVFPALPAFYLVAPDGTVILKDFMIRLQP